MQHGVIGEADDPHTEGAERGFPCGVFSLLLCMTPAIYLHSQAGGVAVEVHDEACDDVLAAKPYASESIGAQLFP